MSGYWDAATPFGDAFQNGAEGQITDVYKRQDVDLKQIAQTTAGFTGADLENLMNEACLLYTSRCCCRGVKER